MSLRYLLKSHLLKSLKNSLLNVKLSPLSFLPVIHVLAWGVLIWEY